MNQVVFKSEIFDHSSQLQSLTLTDGELATEDAHEVITKLVSAMKSFYWLRNFGHQERFSQNDEWSEEMTAAIKSDSGEIFELLRQAREQGKKVSVVANVEVKLEQES